MVTTEPGKRRSGRRREKRVEWRWPLGVCELRCPLRVRRREVVFGGAGAAGMTVAVDEKGYAEREIAEDEKAREEEDEAEGREVRRAERLNAILKVATGWAEDVSWRCSWFARARRLVVSWTA